MKTNDSWRSMQIGMFFVEGDETGTYITAAGGIYKTRVPVSCFVGVSEKIILKLQSTEWDKLLRMKSMK